ncbi:hypothetical protein SCALM49S_06648 [Streptomyces californicus]
MDDTTGILDEALERIHLSGPERDGWLSNHAPMAVEALVRHGRAAAVHRWLDRYGPKLEEMLAAGAPVTAHDWREALGDPRRIGDWTAFFERETAGRPVADRARRVVAPAAAGHRGGRHTSGDPAGPCRTDPAGG